MNKTITVTVYPSAQRTAYDVLICAVGFETRARFFAESQISKVVFRKRIAIAFDDRQELAFEENRQWYEKNEFRVTVASDDSYREAIQAALKVRARSKPLYVCADVSSLSRKRVAILVDTLRTLAVKTEMRVDFVYCPAQFSPPPDSVEPNAGVGPVLPVFAGWPLEPDLPTVSVVGLGYEYDRAVGAVEYIDPTEVWAFQPSEHDERFTAAIEEANQGFFEVIPPRCVIKYDVHKAFDLFVMLESLVSGLATVNRVVILAFGPKLFSLCSLLVACIHSETAVWRVSSGTSEQPIDRFASGKIAFLSARFATSNEQ